MRIVYWNIRAGGGQRMEAIANQLAAWRPDVVGLSEFRGTAASVALADTLVTMGLPFQLAATDRRAPAVNSVMLAANQPLRRVGLRPAPPEPNRWLLARLADGLAVGVMHAPNFVTGRKRPFFDAVTAFAKRWRGGPALIGGDTNTGVPPLDGSPAAFHDWEVDWVHGLAARGWADAYRALRGDRVAHTWYSPNAGTGYRLDQAYINRALMPRLCGARYQWSRPDGDGSRRDGVSDHAALLIDLEP